MANEISIVGSGLTYYFDTYVGSITNVGFEDLRCFHDDPEEHWAVLFFDISHLKALDEDVTITFTFDVTDVDGSVDSFEVYLLSTILSFVPPASAATRTVGDLLAVASNLIVSTGNELELTLSAPHLASLEDKITIQIVGTSYLADVSIANPKLVLDGAETLSAEELVTNVGIEFVFPGGVTTLGTAETESEVYYIKEKNREFEIKTSVDYSSEDVMLIFEDDAKTDFHIFNDADLTKTSAKIIVTLLDKFTEDTLSLNWCLRVADTKEVIQTGTISTIYAPHTDA